MHPKGLRHHLLVHDRQPFPQMPTLRARHSVHITEVQGLRTAPVVSLMRKGPREGEKASQGHTAGSEPGKRAQARHTALSCPGRCAPSHCHRGLLDTPHVPSHACPWL